MRGVTVAFIMALTVLIVVGVYDTVITTLKIRSRRGQWHKKDHDERELEKET